MNTRYTGIVYLIICSYYTPGCSMQQKIIGPQQSEYEISYYRRKNTNKSIFVFGHVNVFQSNTKNTQLAGAMISVDNRISFTNETGYYSLTIEPGNHSFIVGQIGYYKVKSLINVSQGDSIKLDFYVKEDNRPTTN